MTTEAATLHRLAGELDDLGRRLNHVGAELRAVRPQTESATDQPDEPSVLDTAAGSRPTPGHPGGHAEPAASTGEASQADYPLGGTQPVGSGYPAAPGFGSDDSAAQGPADKAVPSVAPEQAAALPDQTAAELDQVAPAPDRTAAGPNQAAVPGGTDAPDKTTASGKTAALGEPSASGKTAALGEPSASGKTAALGEPSASGRPAEPGTAAEPGDAVAPGHPAGPGQPPAPGHSYPTAPGHSPAQGYQAAQGTGPYLYPAYSAAHGAAFHPHPGYYAYNPYAATYSAQPMAGATHPSTPQTGTGQPASGDVAAGQSAAQPSHGQPTADQSAQGHPQATFQQSPYGQPPYGQPPYAPPLYTPPPTLRERLGREGAGSRLLAWVGGAVTLLGVVLLLILAIQRGWLGPLPRVAVGAAFGGILVGAGAWLHRKPAARTGAFALVATGIATLYLDTVAATSLFDFLPVPAGLAVGLAIAVGGLVLAVKWDSPLLATAVVGGCGVCAPLITWGFTDELVTFLLMIQIATVPVQLRRSWWPLSFTAAIPPLTAAMIGIGLRTLPVWAVLAAGVASAAAALISLRRNDNEPYSLSVLAVSPLPILVAALVLHRPESVLLAGGTAAVLIATWILVRGNSGTVAGIAGLVAAMQATVTQFDGGAVLLGEAVVLAFAAKFARNRFALGGSLVFAVIGGLFALGSEVTPALLVLPHWHPRDLLLTALASAALLLAAAIALPWAAIRLDVVKSASLAPWLPAGLCALYGAAGLVLAASMLVAPGRVGFLVGHTLVTVSWTVVAFVLLLRGIEVVALRIAGLVLVAAAVAKLVLFDLAALDGLARVGAFLGAGVILLVAGARYAKVVASR
ncbi:DUF2339 domain-containing protein [Amycolatopsis dendrobii]|uniref:DUF2339 domain-containing protein n=1 Tax=Amycolatopsis dendrobii TaxID=2760662 RepID=UPI001FE3F590|nr:DUF2339 domain-containing protein [Amycolatopsis dendrobii]